MRGVCSGLYIELDLRSACLGPDLDGGHDAKVERCSITHDSIRPTP